VDEDPPEEDEEQQPLPPADAAAPPPPARLLNGWRSLWRGCKPEDIEIEGLMENLCNTADNMQAARAAVGVGQRHAKASA
jgi:hypothetical protein